MRIGQKHEMMGQNGERGWLGPLRFRSPLASDVITRTRGTRAQAKGMNMVGIGINGIQFRSVVIYNPGNVLFYSYPVSFRYHVHAILSYQDKVSI